MNGFEHRMENRDLPLVSTMGDLGFLLSDQNPGMTLHNGGPRNRTIHHTCQSGDDVTFYIYRYMKKK